MTNDGYDAGPWLATLLQTTRPAHIDLGASKYDGSFFLSAENAPHANSLVSIRLTWNESMGAWPTGDTLGKYAQLSSVTVSTPPNADRFITFDVSPFASIPNLIFLDLTDGNWNMTRSNLIPKFLKLQTLLLSDVAPFFCSHTTKRSFQAEQQLLDLFTLPDSLKTLEIGRIRVDADCPHLHLSQISSAPSLTTLSVAMGAKRSLPPGFADAPHYDFNGSGEMFPGKNVLPATLQSLSLKYDTPATPTFLNLPGTLTGLKNLRELTMSIPFDMPNLDIFLNEAICLQMPYQAFRKLAITGKTEGSIFAAELPNIPCLSGMKNLNDVTLHHATWGHLRAITSIYDTPGETTFPYGQTSRDLGDAKSREKSENSEKIAFSDTNEDVSSSKRSEKEEERDFKREVYAIDANNVGINPGIVKGIRKLSLSLMMWTRHIVNGTGFVTPLLRRYPLEWSEFAMRFPDLEQLELNAAFEGFDFPGIDLQKLKSLTSLNISAHPSVEYITEPVGGKTETSGGLLMGTIPPELFLKMPRLTSFAITKTAIEGTFPWFGLSNLQSLTIASNTALYAWPSLNLTFSNFVGFGAPKNLKHLIVYNNANLTQIPDDASFEALVSSLEFVNLGGNRPLKSFFPWSLLSNKSSAREIHANYGGWKGPLPSVIEARNLTTLRLSSDVVSLDGELCGSLPLFKTSLTDIKNDSPVVTFTLAGHTQLRSVFPGSYSSSWWSELDLTELGGVDGPMKVDSESHAFDLVNSIYLTSKINLANTGVNGSLPNLTSLGLDLIDLAGTRVTNPCTTHIVRNILCTPPPMACGCSASSGWENFCSNFLSYCNGIVPGTVPPPDIGLGEPGPCPQYVSVVPAPPIPPEFTPSTTGCPLPHPGGDFVCVGGVWVSYGDTNPPSLIIPPNSQVTVIGDLNIGKSLVLSGFNATALIEGCVFIGSNSITIEMTQEELEALIRAGGSLTRLLLSTTGGNTCPGSTDLTQVKVISKKKYSGCKKIKAEPVKSKSSRGSLTVLFSIDNSVCHMIIIIPTVLGAFILLSAIGAIVIYHIRAKKFAGISSETT